MKKERIQAPVNSIVLNEGQIPWLPENPRQWTREDVELTKASLKRDPDFQEDNPLKLVKTTDGKYLAFAGNLRTTAAKELRWKTFEAILYTPENADDEETIRRRALLDNGSFGSWYYDRLADKWNEMPFKELGIKVWENPWEKTGLSTAGREGGEGYDEFVDKFNEEIPLTTDDCYTPPEVYEIIRKFVDEKVTPLAARQVIRPFYPGGNYEDLKQYPKGCVVLDNPPFSIFSKIVRFYLENGIDFFLFGPLLTLCSSYFDGVCYCVFSVPIRYENGAVVNTGFVTNMRPDTRIWVESSVRQKVQEAQKTEPDTTIYDYPANLITAARLNKVANCGEVEISNKESEFIRNLDNNKEIGKGLYGSGFLISTAAAKRVEKAAEKARAEAEKARAIKIELSTREKAIVARLDAAKL